LNSLDKLLCVCCEYKNKKFGIYEFQSKIETVLLPDNYKSTLELLQHDTVEYLEKIIYFYPEIEHYKYAVEIADNLINAIISEQEK